MKKILLTLSGLALIALTFTNNAYYTAADAAIDQKINAIQAQLDALKAEVRNKQYATTDTAAKTGESNVLADIFTELMKAPDTKNTQTTTTTTQSPEVDWAGLAQKTLGTLFGGQPANRVA